MRSLLQQRQIRFEEKPIEYGVQFRCASKEVINVYDSGSIVVAGKKTAFADEVKQMVESGQVLPVGPAEGAAAAPARASGPSLKVFIVYGHDEVARDSLELLLRRLGMDPIVLQHLPAAGDTIIEKLEQYLGEHGNVGFACVLLTPDDEGHKAGRPEDKKYRARQNVILELGMVLGRLGRRRVAIIYKESVEQPSDIAGLIYISFKERVEEINTKLFRELQTAGFSPQSAGL